MKYEKICIFFLIKFDFFKTLIYLLYVIFNLMMGDLEFTVSYNPLAWSITFGNVDKQPCMDNSNPLLCNNGIRDSIGDS